MIELLESAWIGVLIFCLFAIPLLSIPFFAYSLVTFILTKRKYNNSPDSVSLKKVRMKKALLIISAIIMVVLIFALDHVLSPFLSEISFM